MNKITSYIAVSASAISLSTSAFAGSKPNVVIIYGDDVGYGDIGVNGSTMIPTPNIDKLASEGLNFTDGHCSAATCTPSRFSMLTGVHGFRNGVRILPPNAPLSIPLDKITLPRVFKKAGYKTAIIGKWHLGIGKKGEKVDWNGDVKPGPIEVGFDYSFLLPSTNDRVPCVYVENHRVVNLDPKDPISIGKKPEFPESTVYPDGKADPEAMTYYRSSHGHNNSIINGIGRIGYMCGGKAALWNDETMADEFVNQAKKYIAAQKKDQPFFLFFSSQDIHVPRAPHKRFQGKTKLGYRGDAMVQFDWSVGQVMKALEDAGLRDNTMIIFSSDNGPVYDDGYKDGTTVRTSTKDSDGGHDGSGPYRGGKYQILEGGTRVPFIVSWPGTIKPGTSSAMMNQIDFVSSFAKMFEVKLEDDDAIDSRNMINALIGADTKGLPYMLEEAGKTALRKGDWKFIPGNTGKKNKKGKTRISKPQLFDLSKDLEELKNVADQHPEIVKELEALHGKLREKKGIRFLKEEK